MKVSKTSYMWKKYIWNSSRFTWRNGKYLADIIQDTVSMCVKVSRQKLSPTTIKQKQSRQVLMRKI